MGRNPRSARLTLQRAWVMMAACLALASLAACGPLPNWPIKTNAVTPTTCDLATQWRPPADNVALDDLAMVAPDEGWAVGALTNTQDNPVGVPTGVIYHLTQGQWRRLPQTYPGAQLSTISMGSPTDGWAASTSAITGQGARALVLHYTGGQWRQVDIPALDQALKGPPGMSGITIDSISLQMFGPDAGWLYAMTDVPRDPNNPASRFAVVILRYERGAWTPVPLPPVTITSDIFTLIAVSAAEAWAPTVDYGNMGDLATTFAHYINGSWSLWPRKYSGVTELMAMSSPAAGWAFNNDENTGANVMLRYNGASWTPAPLPGDWVARRVIILPRAFPMPNGVTWFPATQVPSEDTFLVAYDHGQWRKAPWPYPDTEPLRLFPDATGGDIWGIGAIAHQKGCPPTFTTYIQQGVFLHYQQGRWSRVVLP
jgi:hypothetical protein